MWTKIFISGAINVTPNTPVQVNPQTGQPDYSLQWAEYYRSLGMHREAEMIEQQAKNKAAGGGAGGAPGAMPALGGPGGQPGGMPGGQQSAGGQPGQPPTAQPGVPQATSQASAQAVQNGSAGQPDYSAQWAEYYRSIGKIKEAEAIETQMKNKVSNF